MVTPAAESHEVVCDSRAGSSSSCQVATISTSLRMESPATMSSLALWGICHWNFTVALKVMVRFVPLSMGSAGMLQMRVVCPAPGVSASTLSGAGEASWL